MSGGKEDMGSEPVEGEEDDGVEADLALVLVVVVVVMEDREVGAEEGFCDGAANDFS